MVAAEIDCRHDHKKPDAETEPIAPERGLHIGGLAGADRHARSQFGKRCRTESHHERRPHKGKWRMHAAAPCSETDQNVDSGSDGYAEPIQHRVCQRERPNKAR